MIDDEITKVSVTVCIAMSEGGTFLSSFVDTNWVQEEQRYKDMMKRVREDKQLWSVKYIRTSIPYPISSEKVE